MTDIQKEEKERGEFDQWWHEIENFSTRCERLTELSKDELAQVAFEQGMQAARRSQPEGWISVEVLGYVEDDHPSPDMLCRDLSTNRVFRCDAWVGCALPHDVRPSIGTLVNFREGPTTSEGIYLPHVAEIAGKIAAAPDGRDG